MPKTRDKIAEEPETVLLKAATTIGRAAGKLAGLVSRKSADSPAKKKRTKPKIKRQTSARKQAARKKTRPSRKKKSAVVNSSKRR